MATLAPAARRTRTARKTADELPEPFAGWFAARGWTPRRHQVEAIEAQRDGADALLVAPTGGGKTLAGFLPSLIELAEASGRGLHTLYLSPLKALAVDVHRNLEVPVAEMRLRVRAETRTGDTSAAVKARQRRRPPDLLLTTPESLANLLAAPEADGLFRRLRRIVVDEVHALAGNKRGDMLALGLARLRRLAPEATAIGLSATVARPDELIDFFVPPGRPARLILGDAGPDPEIALLVPTEARMPWAGHIALYALEDVYRRIRAHGTTLVFVNTRAAAELVFQALWRLNEDGLPIGLHHGSLNREQRLRTEAAMARGQLRAVVCTSSLDLGIDWGAVDLVVQIGAPKGTSRLLQRIGRANHRLDSPSRALLVPGNRFEVLECLTAIEAVAAGEIDGDPPRTGGLDVLAQHLVGLACAGPFDADDVYAGVRAVGPYRSLTRADFDAVLEFAATGGYALRAYERFRRLVKGVDGLYRLADRRLARQWKMNVGVIVEAPTLRVRLKNRRTDLGSIEEHFVNWLTPGDTFLFAGRLLQFEGVRDTVCEVTPAKGPAEPRIPAYMGGRLPLSTNLARRVRALLAEPGHWDVLPEPTREWLRLQARRSVLPAPDELLVETFPRGGRHYLIAYVFAGRNAHQTLGMLLTRRMERAGLKPMGYVASDYVIATWSLEPVRDVAALFDVDILGDELEEWMAESSMLKRTFRNVAIVAGLIERRHPGTEKTGRQLTVNADLIYDVLRKYEPDHVLLRATRAEAAGGLTDIKRLADVLGEVQGRIRHVARDRITPLALPTLMEIGRETVYGTTAEEELLDEMTVELMREAGVAPDALPG